jgi:WD40 repeat protein/energy-coupling factor transporter ATP-binding protein EcfA2
MDAQGELRIPVEHGRLIAHGDGLPGFFIEGGYSGAPILDGRSAVLLGMAALAVRERDRRTAFILPIQDLERAWPPLARPYQGLAAFRESDARFFNGRDRYVQELADKLDKSSLIAIVGPSGSGKSSLVRAGLLPLLRSQQDWRAIVFRPAAPNASPFVNLVLALDEQRRRGLLLDVLAQETQSVQTIAASLIENPQQLTFILKRLTEADGRPILLVGDQFEELFATVADPYEHDFKQSIRAKFVRSLAAAISAVPACKCVLTIRADYMGQVLKTPDFAKLLRDADVKLGPMNPGELREAITLPAGILGVQIDDDLVSELLAAVGSTPDALPLLEFALTEFWVQQQGRRIRRPPASDKPDSPAAILQDPLIRHADQVFEEMVREYGEPAFRNVMVGLVWIADSDSGGQDTRRVRRRSSFTAAEWQIVEQLASEQREARLITMRGDEGDREATAEIAHEVLIRQWPRLQDWLNDDRAFRLWYQATERDANTWRKQREPDILYRGGRLQEALRWERERGASGPLSVADFIRAAEKQDSEEAARQEKLQKAQLEQARTLAKERKKAVQRTKVGLIIAIGFAMVAMWQWKDARTAAHLAAISEREAVLQDQFKEVSLIDQTISRFRTGADAWQALASLLERDIRNQRAKDVKPNEDQVTINNEKKLQEAIKNRDDLLRQITPLIDKRYNTITAINVENRRRWRDDISSSRRDKVVADVVRFFSSPNSLNYPDFSTPPAFSAQGTLRMALYAVAAIPDDDGRLDARLRKTIDDYPQLNFFTPPAASQVWGIAFDPKSTDEIRAAVGDGNGVVWLWNPLDWNPLDESVSDPSANRNLRNYTAASSIVNGLSFSVDGNWLAAAYRGTGSVVWDLESGNAICVADRPDDGGGAYGVAFDDRGTLAVAANDRAIHLWEIAEGGCRKGNVFKVSDVAYGVAFGPEKRLAAASGDGIVTVWKLDAPGEPYRKFSTVDKSPAFAVAFSPDGKMIAATAADGRGYLWDIETQNGTVLPSGGGTLGQVAFSPDGHWLVATAKADGAAILTDARTHQERAHLGGGGRALFGVAFSPNSNYLLTGDLNGVVGLWPMVRNEKIPTDRNGLIELGRQRVSDMTLSYEECGALQQMKIPIFSDKATSGICQLPFLWAKPGRIGKTPLTSDSGPNASSRTDQKLDR